MVKKKITVDEFNLAYLELNNGQNIGTIFLVHGNSCSINTWRKQLNDEIFINFRIIAIDLPAHGNSEAAPNPSYYSLPQLAKLMAKLILRLTNNQRYIIIGLSLGTNIVSEMLAFDISPVGLILAGPSITGTVGWPENIIKPGTHLNVIFDDEPNLIDIKSYGKEVSLSSNKRDQEIFLEDFISTLRPFRSSLAHSIATNDFKNEVQLLMEKNIKTLVVFGQEEKIIKNNYLDDIQLPLWKNKIFKIPKASHLVNIDNPEGFNAVVKEFANDCFK